MSDSTEALKPSQAALAIMGQIIECHLASKKLKGEALKENFQHGNQLIDKLVLELQAQEILIERKKGHPPESLISRDEVKELMANVIAKEEKKIERTLAEISKTPGWQSLVSAGAKVFEGKATRQEEKDAERMKDNLRCKALELFFKEYGQPMLSPEMLHELNENLLHDVKLASKKAATEGISPAEIKKTKPRAGETNLQPK